MRETLKQIYIEYIGWVILIIIIFPLIMLLDIKFLEMITKLKKNFK